MGFRVEGGGCRVPPPSPPAPPGPASPGSLSAAAGPAGSPRWASAPAVGGGSLPPPPLTPLTPLSPPAPPVPPVLPARPARALPGSAAAATPRRHRQAPGRRAGGASPPTWGARTSPRGRPTPRRTRRAPPQRAPRRGSWAHHLIQVAFSGGVHFWEVPFALMLPPNVVSRCSGRAIAVIVGRISI